MKSHTVQIGKNLIVVDVNLLSDFFGRNKNTIRGWKNSKEMPVYETDDRGVNYFNLLEVYDWKKIHISEKFNHNKDKQIDLEKDEDFKLVLPYGLELADIDLDNSKHLAVLAAHPMGELIRDTLEFVKQQAKREADVQKSEFELRVRKKEFLKTEELNARMSEFIAMVKDIDINARAKFPVEIMENLLNADLIKPERKADAQSIISESIDEVQQEKYKIISEQFMKHIVGKTKEVTVEFLEEMIDYIKKEES